MKPLIPIVFALALAPLAALAEDSAPAAAPVDTLAPPNCAKPVSASVKIRKADDDSAFQERLDAYKTCIESYASAQSDLAQRHQTAANAAIAQFNDFVKEANARNNK